jgi:hypothetical protein
MIGGKKRARETNTSIDAEEKKHRKPIGQDAAGDHVSYFREFDRSFGMFFIFFFTFYYFCFGLAAGRFLPSP